MDPVTALGLLSSVAQLAETSFKIIKLLDTIREGGKSRRKLCDEITLLWMTLRNLETQFGPLSADQDGDWMKPIDSLADHNGVFDQLRTALDDVWEKLTTSDTKRAKMMQTLRWPLDQGYVDRIVGKIERLKTLVIMVMGQTSIALAQDMRGDVSYVTETVEDGKFKRIVDWLSPCNFVQRQETITAAPGTGGWFFTSEQFKSWESGDDRWLWCYGIPGAGKTFLASTAANELRRLHEIEDDILVLIAFCSFDSSDSQSTDHLVTALLKQIVQCRLALPENLEVLYKKHHPHGTRPKLPEFCDILGAAISQSPRTYIIIDALDELADESKRVTLLETIYALKGDPKVMITSRKMESIANRFGYPLADIYCDGCGTKRLETYNHCEDCVDYDLCDDCRQSGEIGGHVFVRRYSSIKMRIAAQPEDIRTYVNRRIEVEEDLRQMVERRPELRVQILDTILKNAQDMFLLARFHMDALAECLTEWEVENALNTLPKGINGTYDQAMARISKQSPNRQRAVKRLLLWVSYAERPLTAKGIEHATAVHRGVREIHSGHVLSAKTLTSLSAGLVIIDENEMVRLTHKTAEDYFLHKRVSLFPNGDIEIAECCLAYLQLAAFENGPCTAPDESVAFEARLRKYPFLGYAAGNWGHHARRCKSSMDIIAPQALMFLRSKQLLEASVQALWYTDTISLDSWDVSGGVDALHIASWFGLHEIVEALLDEGADPNSRDSRNTTPLTYACLKGHLDVTNTLLDAGAHANLVDDRGSTPLHCSVKNRYVDLTRRLIREKDVAINATYTSWNNFTALILACRDGDTDLVRALLSRSDVDVNLASHTAHWNPLIIAAYNDNKECIEILLQHPKIEKDYTDAGGRTALHCAAKTGHIKSMQALLQGGVNPNIKDAMGGPPIHRAVDENELAAVDFVLQHKANCNYTDNWGRNILHAAALTARTQILRLLLVTCKDLNVNAQGNDGETPLHDAVRGDHYWTAKTLLEFGARTDVLNKSGRTPVRAAQDAGNTRLLEALKEARDKEIALDDQIIAQLIQKADTFAIKTEQPLTLAVQKNDLEILRERIARAKIDELNAYSPDSKHTPLHIACVYRDVEVVKLLLEAGAFVDPIDTWGQTPLCMGCAGGNLDIVQQLVKYGADVNNSSYTPWEIALTNDPKAAVFLLAQPQTKIDRASDLIAKGLGWAAALGNLEACKRLVKAGAPIQLKSTNGMTPIQVAKNYGHKEVEQFLFEAAATQKALSSPGVTPLASPKDEINIGDREGGVGHPPG